VAISFNGNRYALPSAEIACLSPNAFILNDLAEAFWKGGREGLMDMVDGWMPNSEGYSRVYRINDDNRETLIEESEAFRKQVRGVAVGSLG
jgi:predicted HAD superfamily phosphohydrolase